MEKFPSDWDLKNLVKELSQGRELARQLQFHLNDNAQSSSSDETGEFLLHRIVYSYDQALSMLGRPGDGAAGAEAAPPAISPASAAAESPQSLTGSPHSDDSDPDLKDQASRKRSSSNELTIRWTQKVKVCTGTGIEGHLDDGYGWRKYGQKDILGAKHPRGYYRCTHRHGQGCLATKQVQRSDDDPTIFEITYRRKHTCNPRANSAKKPNPPVLMPYPQNEDPNPLTQNPQQLVSGSQHSPQHEPLFNIQTSLRVITQDLGTNENPSLGQFSFPSSSSINHENNHIFSDGNTFLGNYSPSLLSPATSRSGYFPISTSLMNDNYGGLIPNLHNNSESELSPIVAAMTSATSSPTLGTHFSFGSSEFGSNFSFGNPEFYR